jgi:hypothetical protein
VIAGGNPASLSAAFERTVLSGPRRPRLESKTVDFPHEPLPHLAAQLNRVAGEEHRNGVAIVDGGLGPKGDYAAALAADE